MTEANTKTKAKKPAAAKKDGTKVAARAGHYDVIERPVITERTTMQSEQDKVVFRVSSCATKTQVKEAVEALFKVKVVKVNTSNTMGKTKIFKGTIGKRPDYKKAIVTLEKGQKIDIAAGAA